MRVFKKVRQGYQGFTLIELLIVIGIIAVLAAAVFVALNPLQRFQDSRDARRRTDISAVLSAIKVDQVDNGGAYFGALDSALNETFMISRDDPAPSTTCNTNCTPVTDANNCLSFTTGTDDLVEDGYLGEIPISPTPPGTTPDWDLSRTGYYVTKNASGIITVGACSGEGGAISISR